MIRFIMRIVSLGVDESVSDFDAQRIRTLNLGVLMALSVAVGSLFTHLGRVEPGTLFGPVVFVAISLGVFRLQSLGRAFEAALVLNVLGLLLVSLQFYVLGPEFGVHFWFLGLILFPFLSMPRSSTRTPVLLGSLATVIFGVLARQDQLIHGYPQDALVTQILASVLLLGLSVVFRLLVSRVEDRVEEQQRSIASAQAVIEQFPEQNPNVVLRLDEHGCLLYGNPASHDLLNRMGLELGDRFPVEMPGAQGPNETSTVVEVGEQILLFKIAPVPEFGFLNLYATDITALNQVEAARAESNRALEREREVSRLKEEFLASLSHELRTPLNAVLGLSEALQEEVYGPLTLKQRESLQTIWDSGDRLLKMFSDILDFSRIGAGRFPTQIEPINLGSCLQAVVHRQSGAAAEAGLRISLDVEEPEAIAMVDMRHLQRVMMMLLDNAIKFTPRGGQVGVSMTSAPRPDWLEVRVWDTGIGIAKEKQALLFEPFVQIEGGLSRRYGGTGLGLALTARLSRLLGASLRVESEEGEGCTMILQVPSKMPFSLEVYSDLRCPFCFVLDQWLEEASLSHTVNWHGVEQLPGLTAEDGASERMQNRLKGVLARLEELVPDQDIRRPEQISNTRRALAAIERVKRTLPWRASEARQALYRAIWRDGRDISEWSAIRDVLQEFNLMDIDDDSPEMEAVVQNTARWREMKTDKIPTIVNLDGSNQWLGLGLRSELLAFVDSQLSSEPWAVLSDC